MDYDSQMLLNDKHAYSTHVVYVGTVSTNKPSLPQLTRSNSLHASKGTVWPRYTSNGYSHTKVVRCASCESSDCG